MSIVRTVKRESPFVQLDKEFIGNGKLSLKSTGLLTYLLSKPDGWQIRMKDIQKRFTDGETAVRSGMKELMAEGYINRYRERQEDGTFGDWIYEVYERPEYNPKRENQVQEPKRDFPVLDNPVLENPDVENHAYSNNDFSNNDLINKEEEEEAKLSFLISYFQKNVSSINTDILKSKLLPWLNVFPIEVIEKELENCALYGAKSWKYVENLFIENKKLNILTLEQVEQKYLNHGTSKKSSNARYTNRKAVREETIPEFLKVGYEGKSAVLEDSSEIAERKKLLEQRMENLKAR